MAASTIRFAIIVALVIGGVVVIDQAFPETPTSAEAGEGVTPPIGGGGIDVTESPEPPTGATGETGGGQVAPSPTVVGTRIAVFNGAGVSGLASDTQTALVDEYGYVAAQDPADAPAPVPVTTIYYRSNKDQIEAEFLASDFFKKLEDVQIQKLEGNEDVGRDVQLAIYLGNDYAALKG